LVGKTIVIVGGTDGLGLSAARACVQAGAKVVAVGRPDQAAHNAEKELADSGRVLTGDAAEPGLADHAIAEAMNTFGGFDGLYHVAGGSGRSQGDGPLHEVTDAGIEATFSLNLKSLIYSNRAAVRAFIRAGRPGAVLNMASVLGSRPSPAFFATQVYAAAKAGIVGFTRSCAAYYAPQNIRFNVVSPGLVDTPMARRAAGDDAIQAFIKTKQPLDGGRIGKPTDLDAAVVYLLSDDSAFVTGQELAIDGGWGVSDGQVPR
jgi:NAD(P)-dependent dehydrogenase (short-subunit alcohol dehydrogenase family)